MRYVASIFLISLWAIGLSSHACLIQEPLTQAQMDKADVIFIGQASTIGVPACSGSCTGMQKGIRSIVFNVVKVLKGKDIGKSVEVYWQNGMFGEVDDVTAFHKKYGKHNKVGILLPETIKAHFRCRSERGRTGTGKPVTTTFCSTGLPLPFAPQPNSTFDKPWIISNVCSEAFIQKASD